VSTSDADVDSVDLLASKYGVMTLLSSELVDDCPADALEIFGQNLVESLGRKLDAHMLEGAGSGNDLVGLRNTPSVNTTSIAALPTSFDKLTDVLYEARVDNATPTAWIMHPRSWRVLSQIKTGLASDQTTLLEPNPQQGPQTLLGLPVLQSSQVTVTEGATNVGSWVAAVDGTQVLVGERRPARLEVSRDFAFDTDRVAVRATARYGFALLNPEGVSLGTDLRAA
jgi:HK97 family phage major capsid protein